MKKDDLDKHRRIFHQDSVMASFPVPESTIMKKIAVLRDHRGVFQCPRCPEAFRDAASMRRHAKTCKVTPQSLPIFHVVSVVGPPSLSDLGLVYNAEARLVICAACCYALRPEVESIGRHFARVHEITVMRMKIRERLDGIHLTSTAEAMQLLRHENDPITPIRGIAVLFGFKCRVCGHCVPKEQSIRDHHHSAHRETAFFLSEKVSIQTIFAGRLTKYFQVVPVSPSVIAMTTAAAAEDFSKHLEDSKNLFASDTHLLSPFLRSFRWHEQIVEFCDEDIPSVRGTCLLPDEKCEEDEPLKDLDAVVSLYWSEGQALIGDFYLDERILKSKVGEQVSTRGMNKIQSDKRYYQEMTRLLAFVWRESHVSSVTGFKSARNTGPLVERVSELVQASKYLFSDPSKPLKALDRVLEVLLRFEATDNLQPDFLEFIVVQFLAIRSISSDVKDTTGYVQFSAPGTITQAVARLKYWCRMSILVTLHKRSVRGSDNEDQSIKDLKLYVRDGVRTPFNALEEIMRLGTTLDRGPEERKLPNITWDDNCTWTSLIVKGQRVRLKDIGDTAATLLASFRNLMTDRILLGCDVSALRTKAQSPHVVDEYNNNTPGYCFLDDPRNGFQEHTRDLFEHFWHRHFDYFVDGRTSTGKVVFNPENVRRWLSSVDDASRTLLAYMHIAGGQPARAEELATYTLRNTVNGLRGFYFYRERIMLLQQYHKGMSQTPLFKLIARFLPTQVTADVIVFFVCVRPLQSYLLHASALPSLNRQITLAEHMQYVFVKKGHHFDGPACRWAIKNAFLVTSGLIIGVSQYRQLCVAFMEKHIKESHWKAAMRHERGGFTQEELPYDRQAGHSTLTATLAYARSHEDPYILNRDILSQFYVCSLAWHTLLKLLPREEMQEAEMGLVSSAIPVLDHGTVAAATFAVAAPMQEQMNKLMSMLTALTSQLKAANLQVEASRTASESPTQRAYSAAGGISISEFRASSDVMKNLFGDAFKWKSEQQKIAMALITSKKINLLAVLKTGGGKSCLYLAPARKSNATTVVVIPLAALRIEAEKNARHLGVTCCTYSDGCKMNQFRIVFASVEHISPQFVKKLHMLVASDSLERIVFDEAHTAVTADHYRYSMTSVLSLAQFAVPKILLTATLPPRLEITLQEAFGLQFGCVRQDTSRPSLRYAVTFVDNLESMADKCVKEMKAISIRHPQKGIVFVMTRHEIDQMTGAYTKISPRRLATFHSDMSAEEKMAEMNSWRSGDVDWIVATSAFGQGIDYPCVSNIIHLGGSWSLINYAQETGRGGRNGDLCVCRTIACNGYLQQFKRSDSWTHRESESLHEVEVYLKTTSVCRRQLLQSAMDGIGLPCTSDRDNQECDICSGEENLSTISPTMTNGFQRIAQQMTISPRVTTGHERIAQQAVQAVRIFADDSLVYNEISEYLTSMSEHPACSICFVESIYENHLLQNCRTFRGRCWKCASESHPRQSCRIKMDFPRGVCFRCAIPTLPLGGLPGLHQSKNIGNSCQSPAKDRIICGVWYFYQTRKSDTTISRVDWPLDKDETQFACWLVKKSHGRVMLNLFVLWAAICRGDFSEFE